MVSPLILISSCSTVQEELSYPGGAFGKAGDDNVFYAATQDQRAARYLMAGVVLAAIAAEVAQDEEDALAAARRINRVYLKLSDMNLQPRKDCTLTSNLGGDDDPKSEETLCTDKSDAAETIFSYETQSLIIQRDLSKLMFDIAEATGIRKAIRGLTKLDATSLLTLITRVTKQAPAFRRYFATYRDATFLMGDALVLACLPINEKTGSLKSNCERLKDDLALPPLFASDGTSGDTDYPLRKVAKGVQTLSKTKELKWQLYRGHYEALLALGDRACRRLEARQKIDGGEATAMCSDANTDATSGRKKLATAIEALDYVKPDSNPL